MTVYLAKPAAGQESDALLRKAAAVYTGQDVFQWRRAQTAHGKPYFEDAPALCFSVSHSGGFWACAFGTSPLGLDLQAHKAAPFDRLAQRFFHEDECAWLFAQAYSPEAFYRIWTAKESFLKRRGCGFPAELSHFSVLSPLPDGSVLQYLSAPDGYTMCLCSESAEAVSVIPL